MSFQEQCNTRCQFFVLVLVQRAIALTVHFYSFPSASMLTMRRTGRILSTFTHRKTQRAMLSMFVITAMVFMINGGSALANQFSAITDFSDTIVDVLFGSSSTTASIVDQDATGPANQDATYDPEAETIADVVAGLFATNASDITQDETGPGATNQDGSIDAGALTLAGFDITATSLADGEVDQTATGPANQDSDGEDHASTDLETDVDVLTSNDLGIDQAADMAMANQTAGVDGLAGTALLQTILGTSMGVTDVEQTATGPANQGAGHSSTVMNIIEAIQTVLTFNIVGVFQDCIGECNQNADVVVGAESNVGQIITGSAFDGTEITQGSTGGSANQEAGNLASVIASLLGVQVVTTGNEITVMQTADDGPANQDADIAAGALGTGIQGLDSSALATNLLTQSNTGGSANQGMDNASAAVDSLLGGQLLSTGNLADASQVDGDGSSNQMTGMDLLATNFGVQLLTGEAESINVLDQSNDDGSTNQEIGNASAAVDTVVGNKASPPSTPRRVRRRMPTDRPTRTTKWRWMRATSASSWCPALHSPSTSSVRATTTDYRTRGSATNRPPWTR